MGKPASANALKKLTQEEQTFVINAREAALKTKISERDFIDPRNFNNFMDDFGKHFERMLKAVNQSELSSPSTNKEEYVAKFAAYQASNPLEGSLMDFVSPNSIMNELAW